MKPGVLTALLSLTFPLSSYGDEYTEQQAREFLQQVLSDGKQLLPADRKHNFISCPIAETPEEGIYRTAEEVNYDNPGWEERVSADWEYFSSPADLGKITAIKFKPQQGKLAYRYLSNGTQEQLYEPWSSSKVMAITGAISTLRMKGLSGPLVVDGIPMADLISSIHSYEKFGGANGDSNAIASYFINLTGRERLTGMFHDDWLNMVNAKVRIRGAYGGGELNFSNFSWQDNGGQTLNIPAMKDDPYYQSYRCEECGITGNKPLTTLAEAEWLKRLVSIEREPATAPEYITIEDVRTLLYGTGHSDKSFEWGGMTIGIGHILAESVAQSLSADLTDSSDKNVTKVLNKATAGKWRIWHKLGWGPSETRGRSELVLLAHVCLPNYNGGKEFTLAAQTSVSGAEEYLVGAAGLKMQKLLLQSLPALVE